VKESSNVPCIWFIIAALFFSHPVRAIEAPGAPDLQKPETLNWALHDHPQGLYIWIKSRYRALDKLPESRERIIAFVTYAELVIYRNMSWDEKEDLHQTAEVALQLSLQQGWHEEYLQLHALFRDPQNRNDKTSPEDINRFYQETLTMIRRMGGSTHLWQKIQMEYAQHLESVGQLQEALRIASETYEIVQKSSDIPALSKLVNLMNMANFFNKTGEFDRAQTIWDIAYRELSGGKPRHLSSVMMNTIGHQFFRQHTDVAYQKAADFYQKALQAAQDLNDKTQVAYIHVSLSRLAWKRGQHQEGILEAQKALAILETLGDRPWIGEAYLQKSRNQLGLGLYQDSLDSANRAQQNYDPNNLFDQRYVEQIRAEAWKGLKRYDEAFAALKLAHELDSKLVKEQSHAEVSSQLADLGLKVEQARSDALARDNDQKERELQDARRFRIILLILLLMAALVMGLMIFSLHEKKLLAISQKKLRAILDHIDEAIVLIKPDLTIESEYSRFLDSFFQSAPRSLVGAHAIRDIIRQLVENAEDAHLIENALQACFQEDRTVWELNEGHLLHESQRSVKGQLQYFSFHWQAIFNQESRLVRVLLGVRDVTHRKRMEAAFAAERQEKFSLFEKVHELLSVDRAQVLQLLDRLQKLKQETDSRRIRFDLHGFKGLARTLHLKQLAEAIHIMENQWTEDPKLSNSRIDWTSLDTVVAGYRRILEEVLVSQEAKGPNELGLLSIAADLMPDLRLRVRELGLNWGGFDIEDHIEIWDARDHELVRELLLHATSNSLDHGYKFPQQRGERVRPFHMTLRCQDADACLELHIQDQGAGIHWSALAEKAQRLQISWQTQEELTALLFMDGVSTAAQLSTSSGRGVGLSAMKHLLDQLGGHIRIQSSGDSGTIVTCSWPRQQVSDPSQRSA
jgi:tetratricopeptide (TPR) repeat protein